MKNILKYIGNEGILIMSEINMNKIVGDTFEEMSIIEMTRIQGAGDIEERAITTPVCVAASLSSVKCAGAASAIASAVSGAIVSIVKC